MNYKEYQVRVYENGDRIWYLNGKLHREDGAAVEWEDGTKEWYLNGVKMSEDEHKIAVSKAAELTIKEIEALLGFEVKIVK